MKKNGYEHYYTDIEKAKITLLNNKFNVVEDIFMKDTTIDVFESSNHIVILSENFVVIHTKDGVKHLRNYMTVLNYIMENMVDDITEVNFEASIMNEIKSISEVEQHYRNLKINSKIGEEHKKFGRNSKINKVRRIISEGYTSNYIESFFDERRESYIIEEKFIVDYNYNHSIGKIIINMSVFLVDESISKNKLDTTIEVLKEKQFDLLLNSFTDQYIHCLCKK